MNQKSRSIGLVVALTVACVNAHGGEDPTNSGYAMVCVENEVTLVSINGNAQQSELPERDRRADRWVRQTQALTGTVGTMVRQGWQLAGPVRDRPTGRLCQSMVRRPRDN